jgi:hypothetical protein
MHCGMPSRRRGAALPRRNSTRQRFNVSFAFALGAFSVLCLVTAEEAQWMKCVGCIHRYHDASD